MQTSRLSVRRVKQQRQQSSALIITLFFVALMTILAAGFLSVMRLETVSSYSHHEGVLADLYAQSATDMALTRLYAATSDTNRFWVSQPGRLYVSPIGTNLPVSTEIDLSSGNDSDASPSANDAVNLNPPSLTDRSIGLIATTNAVMPNAAMYARWIYQFQDGTLATNLPTSFTAANPVVGRYAFWVDDESARINLNTAFARGGNTNALAHPSRIDLDAISGLSSTDATAILNFRNGTHFFDSVDQARQVSAGTSTAFSTDAFAVTHLSHAPELNMFGEPRIFLTTQTNVASAAGSTNFLDILNTPGADPGSLANLNSGKVSTTFQKIVTELNRANWPLVPGASFASKYNGNVDTAQIAMGIIDYVRCAESTNTIVEPLRGTVSGTSFTLPSANGGGRISAARHPLITEFGLTIVSNPVASGASYKLNVSMQVIITLPKSYGLATVDLSQCYLEGYLYVSTSSAITNQVNFDSGQLAGTDFKNGSTILNAGQSVTLTRTYTVTGYNASTLPKYIKLTPILESFPAKRTLCAPDMLGSGIAVLTGHTAVLNTLYAASVDDPNVTISDGDWTVGGAVGDFNSPQPYSPTCTVGKAPSPPILPQQDITSGNLITDASMQMPAPAGTSPTGQTANPLGRVYSVGELGFVHTGMDGASTALKGVPWRTIRLQPETASSTDLPDWAILDLFAVPVSTAPQDAPFIYPGNSTNNFVNVGGKINVNSAIVPFTDGSGNPLLNRPEPLEALVYGASLDGTATVSAANAATLAANIASRTLATGGRLYPNTNFYYCPGQLAEIKGIADGGEATEALMREVTSLATTRGNVFSIYSVGQAVKQDGTGAIHIQAERRTQRIFERVIADGVVTFQPVFSQNF